MTDEIMKKGKALMDLCQRILSKVESFLTGCNVTLDELQSLALLVKYQANMPNMEISALSNLVQVSLSIKI